MRTAPALFPVLALLPALALTACGDPAPQPTAADNQQAAAAGTAMADQVAALSEGQREAVFIRAIRDAGINCQGVTSAERGSEATTWVATCQDGSRHSIQFGADGMAQVTSIVARQ